MPSLGTRIRATFFLAGFAVFLGAPGLYPQAPENPDATPKGVQVGQLFVTALAVGTVSASYSFWGLPKSPKKGYHFVVVNIRIQNVTIYPNCTEWNMNVVTNTGHKYGTKTFRAPDTPDTENLPARAEIEGSYAFDIRDGESPLSLSVEYEIERICWTFVPAGPFRVTVHIPLEGLPEAKSRLYPIRPQPMGTLSSQQPEETEHKITYTLAEYNAYQAEHNESNPLLKIGLIDSFISRYPSSPLLVNFYLDAVPTYYYQLDDYPNTVKYADILLALGDKVNPASQNEIRTIRADALEKMR